MNNDNKVETAIAGLNCWASYATVCFLRNAVDGLCKLQCCC